MPQRSNDFQRLVAFVQRALAPTGARITESAMVPSVVVGGEREVDILIEVQSGQQLVRTAVEAKDEGRRMDIVKFESIVAKYSKMAGLLADRVIVINRRGFSNAVHERAKVENISLFTLEEAMAADWAK